MSAKVYSKILFFIFTILLRFCSGKHSMEQKTVQNPFKSFIQFTFTGTDYCVHFIYEGTRNISHQKEAKLSSFIHESYNLRKYQTLQITNYKRVSINHQRSTSSLNQASIANNIRRYVSHDSRRHAPFTVNIYMSVRVAQRVLRNSKLKVAPTIILLNCDKSKSDEALTKAFQKLANVPVTSIIMALHYNNSYLSLICFTCEHGFERIGESNNYKALLLKWKVLNGNLRMAKISIFIQWEEKPVNYKKMESNNCNIHNENVITHRTFKDLCLHKTIQKLLNYTFNPYQKPPRKILRKPHGAVETSMDVTSLHIQQKRKQQFEILGRGMLVDPYVFFATLDPLGNQVFVMLRPFDMLSWIFLATTILSFSYVLFMMPLVAKNVSFINIFLSVLGTYLDQPTNIVFAIFRITRLKPLALMLVWTMWTAMVVQVGNLYKGTMVSLLAAKLTPFEPSTLQELLDSKLDIVSRDESYVNGTKLIFGLRDLHLNDILNATKKRTSGMSIFNQLHDALRWGVSSLRRFEIALAYKTPFDLRNNETIDLTKNFAVMETQLEAEFRRDLVTALSEKCISKIYPVSYMLTSRQISAVRKNYFHRFFSKAFASVEESGLYSRWAKFAWSIVKQRMLNDARSNVNKVALDALNETGTILKFRLNLPTNTFGYIFTNQREESYSEFKGEMAMSMAVHKATFAFLLVLLGICFLIFVFEKLFNVGGFLREKSKNTKLG